jgi:2-polyprenyl-3-methyl-5-hydroxy-6-metoxy-1,4-benzoquinol methylase
MTKSYLELLEDSLAHARGHKNYENWKRYALNAIDRGLVIKKIIAKFVHVDDAKVLDVGCGDGGISIAFGREKNSEIYSFDINRYKVYKSIARAKEEKTSINFLIADGLHLPFKPGSFDIAICNDVIEHVPHPQQLVKETHGSLRTGGFLYVCVPNAISPYPIIRDGHYRLFGVSLLPHKVGEYYVTKIRKVSRVYDVYGPFNYWLIRGILKDMFRLVDCYHEQQSRLGRLIKVIPNVVLRFLYPCINIICEKKC